MAAQWGLSIEGLLSQLVQHLPGLVDRMTPDGTIPKLENFPSQNRRSLSFE